MNLISALMIIAVTGLAVDNPMDYKTAYGNAQNGDKPLLVLVTAKWCPPCQVMKSTTIPTLMAKQAFKDFHYATVDLDAEEKLTGNSLVDQVLLG